MTPGKSTHPFNLIKGIRKEEIALALLMSSYFFLVITAFWILKPLKKTLFIGYYKTHAFHLFSTELLGSQAELLAKVLNMVVAFVAVVAFSWLARRFQRERLTYILSLFLLAVFGAYIPLLGHSGELTVWTFYLFGDLYNTLMVVAFFAFLNDSVSPMAARRLYGMVVLGGVLGGAFGSTFLRVWVERLSASGWMWVCIALTLLVLVVARLAGRRAGDLIHSRAPDTEGGVAGIDENAIGGAPAGRSRSLSEQDLLHPGNPAVEGARLVFRSRYLLSLVAIVGLYEIISTVMDFQFTATVEHYLEGPALGRQFASVYAITNIASLVIQLCFTTIIMTRFRMTVSLLILPLAMATASAGFLMVPILWLGSALNTADNALSYSLNQSAKEALYTVTTRDEKYKAKAFIDMFVQRFAKALAVGVSLAITMLASDFESIRWLSLISVALVVVWILAASHAGKEFHERSSTQ